MTTYLLGMLTGVALTLLAGYAAHRHQQREQAAKRTLLESVSAQQDRDDRRYAAQLSRGRFDA